MAPTAFKGTISAAAAADAMARGARRAAPTAEVRAVPLSDGGPGLLDALRASRGDGVLSVPATGPLGGIVDVRVLRAGGDAVLESADACGLHLVPAGARDPLRATTFGVGEALRALVPGARPAVSGAARREHIARVLLGLGGSATVDGGAGMARALGWRLLDGRGAEIPPGGGGLEALAAIVPPAPRPPLPPVTALADVDAPLLGARGAARVFGPQKGADAAAVERLEAGLARLADVLRAALGVDVANVPGAGAAGGLGAGVIAFLGGRLVPGSRWTLDAVGFDALLRRARLVVTGEGAYDDQTGMGKVVGEVVRRARALGVPVVLVCGVVSGEPPAGVLALDGGGRILDAEALAALAESGCARLLEG
ncbi:MAG TPA: glycerate kinase [Longimicrobiales bacterium]|nr:glycerate kinase [Longimicrobiales bacterium]